MTPCPHVAPRVTAIHLPNQCHHILLTSHSDNCSLSGRSIEYSISKSSKPPLSCIMSMSSVHIHFYLHFWRLMTERGSMHHILQRFPFFATVAQSGSIVPVQLAIPSLQHFHDLHRLLLLFNLLCVQINSDPTFYTALATEQWLLLWHFNPMPGSGMIKIGTLCFLA